MNDEKKGSRAVIAAVITVIVCAAFVYFSLVDMIDRQSTRIAELENALEDSDERIGALEEKIKGMEDDITELYYFMWDQEEEGK